MGRREAGQRSKYQFRCAVRWLPRRLHLWWHHANLMRAEHGHGKQMWIKYHAFDCRITKERWANMVAKAREISAELLAAPPASPTSQEPKGRSE